MNKNLREKLLKEMSEIRATVRDLNKRLKSIQDLLVEEEIEEAEKENKTINEELMKKTLIVKAIELFEKEEGVKLNKKEKQKMFEIALEHFEGKNISDLFEMCDCDKCEKQEDCSISQTKERFCDGDCDDCEYELDEEYDDEDEDYDHNYEDGDDEYELDIEPEMAKVHIIGLIEKTDLTEDQKILLFSLISELDHKGKVEVTENSPWTAFEPKVLNNLFRDLYELGYALDIVLECPGCGREYTYTVRKVTLIPPFCLSCGTETDVKTIFIRKR